MSPTTIVVFALLAVASAGRPYAGLRLPRFDWTQVVGGSEAPKNAYPFIVSLQYSRSHFCAGSILDERTIVTAAHCVDAVSGMPGKIVVKAGKHSINSNENTEQEVQVASSYTHERYGGGVGPYDVGILKLAQPLKFTNEVQPIKLARSGSEPSGKPVLCGWGSTSQSSFPDMPDKLQHINLEYVGLTECDDAVRRLTGSSPVHETNVCTGPLTGGISACSGDSGGPLFEKNGNGFELIGIVSWGIVPCGTKGAPSVYTKVSAHNEWIENKVRNY